MGVIKPIALHGHTRAVTRVKFNRDGDLLFSSSKDQHPTVWDAETGERLGTYDGHHGTIWDIDINFCSTLLATGGAEGVAKIWDLRMGECVTTIDTNCPVKSVGFSHGDTMLACVTDTSYGSKAALRIYNLPADTPKGLKAVKTEFNPMIKHETAEGKITCAVWGPTNDTVYFSGEDGFMIIYNLKDQQEEVFKPVHKSEIKRFCLDNDYTTVLTASTDQTGCLLDAKSLKILKTYETDKPVNDCAISSTSPHVILGGGQDAQSITNLSHRQNKFETRFFHKIFETELGSVSTHFGPVNALAWSNSGRLFASGGEDGLVKLMFFDDDYLDTYNRLGPNHIESQGKKEGKSS